MPGTGNTVANEDFAHLDRFFALWKVAVSERMDR